MRVCALSKISKCDRRHGTFQENLPVSTDTDPQQTAAATLVLRLQLGTVKSVDKGKTENNTNRRDGRKRFGASEREKQHDRGGHRPQKIQLVLQTAALAFCRS